MDGRRPSFAGSGGYTLHKQADSSSWLLGLLTDARLWMARSQQRRALGELVEQRRPDAPRHWRVARGGAARGREAVLAAVVGTEETIMSEPIVFGFPYSTFVHIVRLILTHKGAAYTFRDLETGDGQAIPSRAASLQSRAGAAA